jgi:hypothetical protein
MSAPPPLELVPDPDWLGQPLEGMGPGGTGGSDAAATGADGGGLAGAMGGAGDAFGAGMDAAGGLATAVSQAKQSTAVHPIAKGVDAVLAGAADDMMGKGTLVGLSDPVSAAIPVGDFFIKQGFKLVGVDFSVGDTVGLGIRAAVTGVESVVTDRKEGLARMRARAEMKQSGSIATGIARILNWLRS